MKLTIRVWRQDGPTTPGHFASYDVDDLVPSMSVLELLDRLNDDLIKSGQEPVVFESDCREGICGACGLVVNGTPHGPTPNMPACHQRLAQFDDGATVTLQPLSARAYPVIRDLLVERGALTDLLEAGGHVRVSAGTAPDADGVRLTAQQAEEALDFAACIGCGACVAACPNGAAHLYAGAKLAHLSLLPIPAAERGRRAEAMVQALDQHFGPCSLHGECVQVCPAGIPLRAVAYVNRERIRQRWRAKDD
ncbi:MAG: succinate dehydrogenase/fumarate reductase iron-sulfur subunit [Bowdeniella nasicola]|nr:succinate dehydrogenase/fumarate reductase iron-sulfur subunit [Bowdeniella nasicola]